MEESKSGLFMALIVSIIIFVIVVIVLQYAWNHSINPIFGLKQIGFMEALLLMVVFKIILTNTCLCVSPDYMKRYT